MYAYEQAKDGRKLFRQRLPVYAARLCNEYGAVLTGRTKAARRPGR